MSEPIWTPPAEEPGSEYRWHTGNEEVWTVPPIGSETIYHGRRPIASSVFPEDAERICLCMNALRKIPTEDLRKADGGLLELAGMIANRYDMVLADPT